MNASTRYELQWWGWMDEAWHCQSFHSNKRDALRRMRWAFNLARGKFSYRLLDRKAEEVIQTIDKRVEK